MSLFADKIRDVNCTLIVFCYIFSFYIVGPITSSVLVAIPFICKYVCAKNVFDKYSLGVFMFLMSLIFSTLLFSCIHLTFDFSYLKTLIGQIINMFVGVFIVYGIKKKYRITALDIEKYIIFAFFLQTLIQLIASVTPAFASFLLPFNRAYDFAESEPGRRGLALAAGTGWSLGLAYGLLYIIYVKRYLLDDINMIKILVGVVLLIGTMFAGRTGFLGAVWGMLLFVLNAKRTVVYKLFLFLKVLVGIVLGCLLFYVLFPSLTNHLINNVFPFAFEPLYTLYFNDKFSTMSTNRLLEMWEVTITPIEVLLGTGNFTDPVTGAYYKRIDIGILRNLFYWGVIGYFVILMYQIYLLAPIKTIDKKKSIKWNIAAYRVCLTLYLFVMEFKAMTIGFNKLAVSIVFLLGYFYYNDTKRQKGCANIHSNTLL